MGNNVAGLAITGETSTNQRLFLRYFTATLIDLVVLNLFAEFWVRVTVESFLVSLFAAALLQLLLKIPVSAGSHAYA